ncbi:MAG: FG-GAP-like repeat-containing protein, partial [Ignavibacteria bacterium]|nr:FG-GAP-like repeat-containing protein [Ignavibacteria bacterium]
MNANSRLMSISIMIGMLILFVGASLNALAAEVRRSPGDTLPGAVTDEWLNQLQDENGNRILTGSDPETDAFQIRTMTAFGAGDRFGNSVSSAGDVNGDGYDDLIVGAYANDGGGTDAGRAYIYFGGISFNTVPDVILTGELAGDNFGGIVSSAGDVNGDGFSDVIVSARTGPAASGRIYIFFGGYLMNNIPDVVINGEQVGDAFGTSVSDAGDVNGDGYGDIVAGASQQFGTRQGKMYVFFGGSSMDTIPDVVALGEAVQYDLGIAVSDAGDVNGDGFDDVIAGSHMYNIYGTGKAYTYFGGTSMDSLPDVTFTGLAAGDQFGSTLSGGSDVNGDGFSDVLIGMNGFNNGRDFAYIYLGGVNMDNVADVTLSEPGPLIYGFRVGMAGDMNCDGYGDVLVSAWIYNTVSKVYIYNGGPGMDNRYDMVLTGEGTNDRFGLPAVSAGDINGDGYGDIIIGAHEYNSYTGKVHVYMYGMTGTLIPDLTMNGTQNSSYGKSVSNAGDVNGDGFADFVVGAPYGNNGFGGAFIYFGGEDMDNLADVSLIGENISDNFGFCVSGAGDFNADGYSDVVVGAWENNFSTGKIYFYYGGSYMDSICDFSIIGPNQNSYFGYSLSEAGDVNGDGFGDIIVGAPASDIAYIYYGWSEHFLANLNLDGPAGSSFGISVSGDVDLNGDNFSDIAVGAYAYLGYTGRVYVYLGGTVPNPWPVLTLQGESAGGLFGHSISLIKDINGDAFGEILIGSYGIDDFTGKAYLYLGKPLLDGNVDLEIYGVVYSSFGASVCDCGDINEDGFNDFAVGAPSYNDYQGSAFIYLGGLVCDAIPDIILNGDNFSEFGASISGTGDLDGNENSDIIVGAATYNSSNGKAYVYKTSFPSAIPAILSIKDIPNDQGGYVNVKWAKSAFDQQVSGQVSQYLIERSLPPALAGYNWVSLGTAPAVNNALYNYEARTPWDSSINGNGTFFFRVTALTNTPGVFWRSNIMSGYSVDNLAPLPPSNL